MSKDEIERIIKRQKLCRIAFIDGDYPYIAPFQYLYYNEHFYFHFTDYGKKTKILSKNKNVCVSIEQLEPDLKAFNFISFQGKLAQVRDKEERETVIRKLIQDAKENFSEDFLAAHGFKKEKGWGGFKIENQLIYMLQEIHDIIGLRST
jgi:hypothetical protein